MRSYDVNEQIRFTRPGVFIVYTKIVCVFGTIYSLSGRLYAFGFFFFLWTFAFNTNINYKL